MAEFVSRGEALNRFRHRWGDPNFSAVPINDTCNLQIISPSYALTYVCYIRQLITQQHESMPHVEQLDGIGRHLVAPKFPTTTPQLTMNPGHGGRNGLVRSAQRFRLTS